jgi:hypothetical protein
MAVGYATPLSFCRLFSFKMDTGVRFENLTKTGHRCPVFFCICDTAVANVVYSSPAAFTGAGCPWAYWAQYALLARF